MASNNKNYMLNDKFPKQIKNATSTSDGLMASEDKARLDGLFEFGLLSPVSSYKDGIMTKEDKIKLDEIENGANNYIHPDDENTRHVTDEQIALWDAKASTRIATQSDNGLISSTDKKKLDSIETNANAYTHPTSHAATIITQNETHRFVTDEQIASWNAKASVSVATQTNNGLMSASDKKKLDSIETNANAYIHPTSHAATIITQNETHRFVTDSQISTWDGKASTNVATQTNNGLMSASDKKKLDSIDAVNGNYTHPDTHPATMIEEDETHRFVTDEQISSWNVLIDKVAELEEKMNSAVYQA